MVMVSYTDNTGESDYRKTYSTKEAASVDVQRELEETQKAYEGIDCDWAYLQTVWSFGRLVEMHMLVGSFRK